MTSKLTGSGDDADCDVPKKPIAIFGYKQGLLSIDMKTNVVQHVPRIPIKTKVVVTVAETDTNTFGSKLANVKNI